MTTPRIVREAHDPVAHYAFDGTLVVPLYCLMYHDTNDVKPAASQADAGSEELNQRTFARNFAGLAKDTKAATDTDAATNFPVIPFAVVDIDCTSSAWEVGDFVGADEAASGTALENLSVKKVTDRSLAIGEVVKREASAVTTVRVKLQAGFAGSSLQPLLGGSGSNTETLAATKTLVVGDAPIQVLDPGGAARQVNLPAEAVSEGLSYLIVNAADAAEIITIKDDAAATKATPTQAESALCTCDGTTWFCGVLANS